MFAQKDALFAIDEFIYSPAQKHGSFRFLSSLRTGQRQGQNQEFTFVTHNDHWELNFHSCAQRILAWKQYLAYLNDVICFSAT
jgi:hypothetical protein